MHMSAEYPKIPYGRADFRGIRLDGSLYVDKTAFIRPLEDHNHVLFILRPVGRRTGGFTVMRRMGVMRTRGG